MSRTGLLMFRVLVCALVLVGFMLVALSADAGVRTKLVREAAEFVSKKFAREAAEEGAERLSKGMLRLASKHGDQVVAAAFRRVGPRAGKIATEAGEHGGVALRLLATHGDDALPLVMKGSALKAISRYGDDATTAILRHGHVGEQFVEKFAKGGAEALANVSPRNGRRLAMMAAEGQLKPELLTVVRKYGDECCEFIWSNKLALATGAVLATFVASPEPYLKGTERLVSKVADTAVKPLAEVPKVVASEAAARTNWTPIVVCMLVVIGIWCLRWTSEIRGVIASSKVWHGPKPRAGEQDKLSVGDRAGTPKGDA